MRHQKQNKETYTRIIEGLGCSSLVQGLSGVCEALGSIPAPKKKR
jgi:hypothetical protein